MWILFNPYMGRWLTLKFTQMELHVHNTYMGRWLTLKFTQMELHVHNPYMGRWISDKKISYTNGGIILHKWMWILFNPYMARWLIANWIYF
jgi:hypothetical protein